MTFKTFTIVLICVAAVGIAAATQLKAEQKPADSKPTSGEEKSWISRCEDIKDGEKVTGQYCEAVQQLFVMQKDADPSTAQRVAEMAIGYPPGSEDKAQGVLVLQDDGLAGDRAWWFRPERDRRDVHLQRPVFDQSQQLDHATRLARGRGGHLRGGVPRRLPYLAQRRALLLFRVHGPARPGPD